MTECTIIRLTIGRPPIRKTTPKSPTVETVRNVNTVAYSSSTPGRWGSAHPITTSISSNIHCISCFFGYVSSDPHIPTSYLHCPCNHVRHSLATILNCDTHARQQRSMLAKGQPLDDVQPIDPTASARRFIPLRVVKSVSPLYSSKWSRFDDLAEFHQTLALGK